ncbi:Pyruvate dehydrogenase-like, partial [Tropilaelaps mercedesae]
CASLDADGRATRPTLAGTQKLIERTRRTKSASLTECFGNLSSACVHSRGASSVECTSSQSNVFRAKLSDNPFDHASGGEPHNERTAIDLVRSSRVEWGPASSVVLLSPLACTIYLDKRRSCTNDRVAERCDRQKSSGLTGQPRRSTSVFAPVGKQGFSVARATAASATSRSCVPPSKALGTFGMRSAVNLSLRWLSSRTQNAPPTASKNFIHQVDHYSRFNPSSLSIKQFLEFGERANLAESCAFLRKELPVRLANIMKEIQLLPLQLLKMPSIKLVTGWYQQSFLDIVQYDQKTDPLTESELADFSAMLTAVRNRHSNVVQTMTEGVLELKRSGPTDLSTDHAIQYFLDRFYMSRISIRMLINQHTSLFGEVDEADRASGKEGRVGVIDPYCDITSVTLDAYENAKFLCDQYYLTAPNMHLECIPKDSRIRIVYVPSHLYYILFELFKNAMRAVVEKNRPDTDADQLPPLRVLIVKGDEDVTIRISDRGGGIPRSASDLLFQYMYSTAPNPSPTDSAPLAGYGYGLPLSRLYARYLHGDLTVTSIEGFGTDAHVYIKAISNESHEKLPIFNKTSSKHYSMVIGNNDWSTPVSGKNAVDTQYEKLL